jgi:hypothetical protein
MGQNKVTFWNLVEALLKRQPTYYHIMEDDISIFRKVIIWKIQR